MNSKLTDANLSVSVPSYYNTDLTEVFVFSRRFSSNPSLTSLEQQMLSRRQKGMLKLLLAISGWGLFLLFLLILISDLAHPDLSVLLPEVIALIIIAGCFGLNRLGFTQFAAWFFLLTMQVVILLYLLSRTDPNFLSNLRGASPLLAVTVIAAGVIMGPGYSFIFAGLSIATTLSVGVYRARPGLEALETPLQVVYQSAVAICLFFIMACLAWFFETNFRSLIARLSRQNQNLTLANQQLLDKQAQEQQFARQVNQLTEEVSTDFTQQNQKAADQIEAVLEVTTTVEELDQTSVEVLSSALLVDDTAQQALKVVEEGTERLQLGLASLDTLSGQAERISTALNDLYQRSQQTGQIVALVEEITESMELLALNATIEAAGAGEYGKRFKIVAKEVQNLAGRSQLALEQIHQVLAEVYQATTDTITLAQQGLREATEVMRGTRSMQTILEGIVSRTETTARLARQISVVIEQQRTTTTNIAATMHYISAISSSLKEGNEYLLARVFHLNETVAQFQPSK
jgi:methyl-accepting chemotaxis protein